MAVISEGRRLWLRRKQKTRNQHARSTRPLLTCYRTARHIYAQIVDAESGKTLMSVSTLSPAIAGSVKHGGNVTAAKAVGRAIAEAALAKEIRAVAFNRNGFLYHGRIKALADAAREAGLAL
jgi:large subunit ribosomal protein L18